MPALRSSARAARSVARDLIVAPVPRVQFTFPSSHNLSDSPHDSPCSSPVEPELGSLSRTRADCRLGSTSSSSSSSSSSISSLASSSTSTSPPSSEFSYDAPSTPTKPPLSVLTRTLSPVCVTVTPKSTPPRVSGPAAQSSPLASSPLSFCDHSTFDVSPHEEERRPKRGDDDYIKRPENSWMLFRRKTLESYAADKGKLLASHPSNKSSGAGGSGKPRQADLSKMISAKWRALGPEERAEWDELAKQRKREHELRYPDYVFRPQRAARPNSNRARDEGGARSGGAGGRKQHQRRDVEKPQVLEFVVPSIPPAQEQHQQQHGAPYMTVEVPNIFASPAPTSLTSAPCSPLDLLLEPITPQQQQSMSPTSLVPMLACNATLALQDSCAQWDFQPQVVSAQFSDSLQSSDFLRSIFVNPAPEPFASYVEPHNTLPACFDPLPSSCGDYTSAWESSSPWAGQSPFPFSTTQPVFGACDFDLDKVPGITAGWDFATGALPEGEDGAPVMYPGSEYLLDPS
ncbi:unnamed protein product [Mycena citricolor]|uniref:HMG box domain-containing protein n=1 Tax=Mycena citricolor TaxID=2018698 RepID=A0AAD2Q568_9AGAR|nr:unnamed protein product [Mycena citricolor]